MKRSKLTKPAPRRRAATTATVAPAKKTKAPSKMKAYATFDLYFADQTPKNQTLIRALRKLVKTKAPKLEEFVKWGNGCWVKGKEPIAYVYSAPDLVQFGFFRGASLPDPRGLLEGKGEYVRHVKVRKLGDIDATAFAALLRAATK